MRGQAWAHSRRPPVAAPHPAASLAIPPGRTHGSSCGCCSLPGDHLLVHHLAAAQQHLCRGRVGGRALHVGREGLLRGRAAAAGHAAGHLPRGGGQLPQGAAACRRWRRHGRHVDAHAAAGRQGRALCRRLRLGRGQRRRLRRRRWRCPCTSCVAADHASCPGPLLAAPPAPRRWQAGRAQLARHQGARGALHGSCEATGGRWRVGRRLRRAAAWGALCRQW